MKSENTTKPYRQHVIERLKTFEDAGAYLAASLEQNADYPAAIGLAIEDIIVAFNLPLDINVISPASAAPVGFASINRTELLPVLRESMQTCIRNANDESKPGAYRLMMEHFAEAGRQIIEMIEEGRYSGPISAHICEGCGAPTVVVQVSDDDVVLCPLCYAATPETAPDDRIQCPHCHWRPSPAIRPENGLYKCANCDFKWAASGPGVESATAAATAAPVDAESIARDIIGYLAGRHIDPEIALGEVPEVAAIIQRNYAAPVEQSEIEQIRARAYNSIQFSADVYMHDVRRLLRIFTATTTTDEGAR